MKAQLRRFAPVSVIALAAAVLGTDCPGDASDKGPTVNSVIEFTDGDITVDEGDGAIMIIVTRRIIGALPLAAAGATAADTDFGSANNADYFTGGGVFEWAAEHHGNKNFFVFIIDDDAVEETETIDLRLTGIHGAGPGQRVLTITILDND